MQVTIRSVPVNLRVTSVILEQDIDHPEMMKAFHCPDCGKNVGVQYTGNIVMIVPGNTHALVPLFKSCPQCKKKYLFNSIL